MAWSTLPKPGKTVNGEYIGPCIDECSHRDCLETRRMAMTRCHFCEKTIGFEAPFQKDQDGRLVHFLCAVTEVENESV